jgi:hypothetical protein
MNREPFLQIKRFADITNLMRSRVSQCVNKSNPTAARRKSGVVQTWGLNLLRYSGRGNFKFSYRANGVFATHILRFAPGCRFVL